MLWSCPPRPDLRHRWVLQAAKALALALALATPAAQADDETEGRLGSIAPPFTEGWRLPGGHWRVALSPHAHHWTRRPEHRPVWALGLERQRADGWLAGASHFRNSFGQPSAYGYLGWRSGPLWEVEALFWQWSAGLMYGYVGEYKNKVPMNVGGFSPGALISLGWKTSPRSAVVLHGLGVAGVMLQLSWDLI